MLGLDRVEVLLGKQSYMPLRMPLYQSQGFSSALLARVELKGLKANLPMPAGTFTFRGPPGVHHQPST